MPTKLKTIDDLPLSLTVNDISSILGIGRANAYDLCHSQNFPSVIVGRRIVIPKLAFAKWMENPNSFRPAKGKY